MFAAANDVEDTNVMTNFDPFDITSPLNVNDAYLDLVTPSEGKHIVRHGKNVSNDELVDIQIDIGTRHLLAHLYTKVEVTHKVVYVNGLYCLYTRSYDQNGFDQLDLLIISGEFRLRFGFCSSHKHIRDYYCNRNWNYFCIASSKEAAEEILTTLRILM